MVIYGYILTLRMTKSYAFKDYIFSRLTYDHGSKNCTLTLLSGKILHFYYWRLFSPFHVGNYIVKIV